MSKTLRRNRKAISPVIATIIIVAVAIVMSIAVAYWMMGLATTFTRYEKLEYAAAYPTTTDEGWNITVKVKNTGSATATVTNFLFNGIPLEGVEGITVEPELNDGVTISPGHDKMFTISIEKNAKIGAGRATSGIALEITIVTAAGNQYPKTVVLP